MEFKFLDQVTSSRYKFMEELIPDFDECEIYRAETICAIMFHILAEHKNSPAYIPGIKEISPVFEVLTVAAFLYSHYYDEERPYSSLFEARENILPKLRNYGIDPQNLYNVFEVVECAHGYAGPRQLAPKVDTPSEVFALSVYLFNKKWNDLIAAPTSEEFGTK